MFGSYLVTCGPDIRLQTMTESTWKILKLEWKTPGIFFFQKEWEPCLDLLSLGYTYSYQLASISNRLFSFRQHSDTHTQTLPETIAAARVSIVGKEIN